jgi:hypothetical protein
MPACRCTESDVAFVEDNEGRHDPEPAECLRNVFYPTVLIVNQDFEQYVAFRMPMFSLLKMMVEKYPAVLYSARG